MPAFCTCKFPPVSPATGASDSQQMDKAGMGGVVAADSHA